MNKRTCVALLVCANLALLASIIAVTAPTKSALAQGTGLAGNYVMVAGEIQNDRDALYVIDLKARALHAFYFDETNKKLVFSSSRELEKDFRNNK